MITGVALRINDRIYFMSKPFRHNDLIHALRLIDHTTGHAEQGFVTSAGDYFNRKDAEAQERKAGRLSKRLLGSVLTSEDLW